MNYEMNRTIHFVYSNYVFEFEEEQLKKVLEDIKIKLDKRLREFIDRSEENYSEKGIRNKLKEHSNYIKVLLEKWGEIVSKRDNSPHFSFFQEDTYYTIKTLLFLYYVKETLIEKRIWHRIRVPNMTEKEIEEYKQKAKNYGEYRFEIDYGWKGVLVQDLVIGYIEEKYPNLCVKRYDQNKTGSLGNIDDYDCLINGYKLDIKCATQEHYIEITPKCKVELEKPKHYYIACKFWEENELIIVGYFEHGDLWAYPFKVLYGTPYWGVKLYNAKPLDELIAKLSVRDI